MAYQGISTGTGPNQGNGDTLVDGAIKINANFGEIYNALGDGSNIVLTKDRLINTGAGLTGGGNLNSDRTLSVSVGSGITISSGSVGVDTSVIRTTGNQTIVGVLTATSFVKSGGTSNQFLKADGSVDTNSYITAASLPASPNNGQLTLETSGVGLSGNQTFTANQSGNATFTITSNATSSNTASTIVSRDSSGNFSAGSITATSFVRSGGTSSQFLKADGSVDSNTYLTSAGTGDVPIGIIAMWSGSIASIPTGWKLCNGANGTPDLRDRFIVGAGSAYNPGNTGGSNSVTLTENQIPSHKHTFSMDNERVSGGSGAVVADIRNGGNPTDSGSLSLYRGQETGNTGGGGSHENRPPYYALAFIMKIS